MMKFVVEPGIGKGDPGRQRTSRVNRFLVNDDIQHRFGTTSQMHKELLKELSTGLVNCHSSDRKAWAQFIVENQVSLQSLLSLLHTQDKSAQRFMWLIGDICELDPDLIAPCMPLLFSFRDQMPFPGMPRSVAKWLRLTNVPDEIEQEAIRQLLTWLSDKTSSIACKSYSANALFELVKQGRVPRKKLVKILASQTNGPNRSFGCRMRKLQRRTENLELRF